jgi:hypothetical protein
VSQEENSVLFYPFRRFCQEVLTFVREDSKLRFVSCLGVAEEIAHRLRINPIEFGVDLQGEIIEIYICKRFRNISKLNLFEDISGQFSYYFFLSKTKVITN